MKILNRLDKIWEGVEHPFLIHNGVGLKYSQIRTQDSIDLSLIKTGDVVVIIGDFNPATIFTLLRIIDMGVIVVPLTPETKDEHDYFFNSALVDVIITPEGITRREHGQRHELIDMVRAKHRSGLVLFTTGTTGKPRAILHDMSVFLKRFETPRPALKTINFLLFDHIGGINTLLHTLFNAGVVVTPTARTVDSVLETCAKYDVELLPTTPTFLRLMLMSGMVPCKVPASLKVITYGTEMMDQSTLNELCKLLPNVDFRQTYGMSELGILRVKSERKDSLFMRVGGEGVETKVVDNILQIRSESRMLGYLNAPSLFDAEGWYNTKDVVDVKGDLYKIVGRTDDVINVGGLKFMASDVERVVLKYPGVVLVKVTARNNPITGQHVELIVQPNTPIDKENLTAYLKNKLQPHMMPKRINIGVVGVGHRFKRS